MRLSFTKMQGIGNDFVVIDGIERPQSLSTAQLRRLADRRYGVGCDQVLLVETATMPGAQFRYRIFNADGGEVEQCGNGARCLARYLRERGYSDGDEIRVQTAAGIIALRLHPDGQVSVDMGVPILEPDAIPFLARRRAARYPLQVGEEQLTIAAVSMGNPHAVMVVEDIARAPVERLGPLIEGHERFPRRTNVGFMQVLDRGHIRLRVYERGAGETLACGTGACAAVVAGRLQGLLEERVAVDLPGGRLVITWDGEGGALIMTGPATHVFEGRIEL